ncbi:hypothetical protein ACFY0R_37740 [Streptomyces sp. NPDC001633]|uniref:hypothetical protein n=1 Tax=Streptomyces sp. NPDC001633 TaxID=3364595 RepID=UPI0036CA05CB
MTSPTAQVAEWFSSQHATAVAAAVSLSCAGVAIASVRLWRTVGPRISGTGGAVADSRPRSRRKLSAGTLAAVGAFIICTSVSLNTSYRFTGDPAGLAMTSDVERLLSCAAYESLMAMCVLGARERMAESRSPGWYGSAVWIFAALSAIPAAIEGDGLTAATAVRVIVGSFGSALAAHSALGLDLKHRTGGDSETPAAMLMRDLRARLMSRMGLGERTRTALQIAQERALSRAVELQDRYTRLSDADKKKKTGARIARKLAAAQDAAGIATDEGQRARYIARVALRRNATSLVISEDQSPWAAPGSSLNREYTARIERIEALADEEEAAILQPSTRTRTPLPVEESESTPAYAGTAAARGTAGAPLTVHMTLPWEYDEDEAGEFDEDHQDAEDAEDAGDESDQDDENPADVVDLSNYTTKKDKLTALYQAMVKPGDPRTTNAITDELLAVLAKRGVLYDRGPANRVIGDLRRPDEAPAEPAEAQRSA